MLHKADGDEVDGRFELGEEIIAAVVESNVRQVSSGHEQKTDPEGTRGGWWDHYPSRVFKEVMFGEEMAEPN
jgi:hypothetical protein